MMKFPIRTIIFTLAALAPAHAEDSPIAAAETTFRSTSAEAITPVTDIYINALASLARKFERAGKIAEAREVTAELERIRDAAESGAHPLDTLPGRASTTLEEAALPGYVSSISTGAIFLTPDQATLAGSLEPHNLTRVLRGFYGEKDVATWTPEKFAPGTYDLILDYSSPEKGQENAGGGTITLIAGDAKTNIEIEPQGTETDFRKKIVGRINLTTLPIKISISALNSKTDAGVFRLRALILRPS